MTVDPSDPYTLKIKLNQPYPQLKYLMAMHFTTPQAREAVEKYGDEYARHPVGSGPYKMDKYVPKQRIELSVNPNRHKDLYPSDGATEEDKKAGWLDDAGKQLPLCDKVVFSIVKESTSSWNLFLQGYLDTAAVNNNNYQQVVTTNGGLSDDMKRRGITLRRDPQVNVYYCAFNMEDPTFGGYTPEKRKLRQAISLSIDADEYIQLIAQGNGQKAEWLIPPGVFGNDPKFANPYRKTNIEKAKQLLAEAGYPDGNDPKTGKKLVLGYDNSATTAAAMLQVSVLKRQIERIGIKVESRSTNSNQFQERLLKGQHQFIFYGWFADYPDPENFVFLLYGPNKKPGPNSASYANPEYDKLFDQVRVMNDGPERQALIEKMRAIAVEDCPWIPIYHSLAMGLSYDWLKNTMSHPIANDMAQYRRVDFKTRAAKQAEWNHPIWLAGSRRAGSARADRDSGGAGRPEAGEPQASPGKPGGLTPRAELRFTARSLRRTDPDGCLARDVGAVLQHGDPEVIARRNLSSRAPTQKQIQSWIKDHGYDRPWQEQLKTSTVDMMLFKFGKSDATKEDIWERVKAGAGPSLSIGVSSFVATTCFAVMFAAMAAYFRGTYVDALTTVLCVISMSVVYMVYIIGFQYYLL